MHKDQKEEEESHKLIEVFKEVSTGMSDILKSIEQSMREVITGSTCNNGETRETQERLLRLEKELKDQLEQIKKRTEEQEEREKKNDSMLAMIWAKLQEKN